MNVYARVKNFDKIRKMDATLIDFFFRCALRQVFFSFCNDVFIFKVCARPFLIFWTHIAFVHLMWKYWILDTQVKSFFKRGLPKTLKKLKEKKLVKQKIQIKFYNKKLYINIMIYIIFYHDYVSYICIWLKKGDGYNRVKNYFYMYIHVKKPTIDLSKNGCPHSTRRLSRAFSKILEVTSSKPNSAQ